MMMINKFIFLCFFCIFIDIFKVVFYVNIVIDYVNFGVYWILVFGNVIINIGNCYYNFIGSFVLKVFGIYIVNV